MVAIDNNRQVALARGADLFRDLCERCHSIEEGKPSPDEQAPNLFGVYNRKFTYEEYNKATTATTTMSRKWNEKNLDQYLQRPGNVIRTDRIFDSPIPAQDRKNLIEFLKSKAKENST